MGKVSGKGNVDGMGLNVEGVMFEGLFRETRVPRGDILEERWSVIVEKE